MTNTNTILEKYKESFLSELERACNIYKLIGSGTHESPMWFQLRNSFDIERKKRDVLLFVNSQRNGIYFEIELNEGDNWLEFEAFGIVYDYFKQLKYDYIKENHPTIYTQLK